MLNKSAFVCKRILTLVRDFTRISPLKIENLAHIWAAHESIAGNQTQY